MQIGVLLPAVPVDDEDLLPRGVTEPADRHDERLGDGAIRGEDPEVEVAARPLRPGREGDAQRVVLPAHLVDAVLGRARQ